MPKFIFDVSDDEYKSITWLQDKLGAETPELVVSYCVGFIYDFAWALSRGEVEIATLLGKIAELVDKAKDEYYSDI